MKERKIDILLHPVRLRIIQKFLGGDERTAKELAKLLPEIAQATLYRQLDTLVKANILIITDEKPIRGTIEKVYCLNPLEASITAKDVNTVSKEEHIQYFMLFTTHLLAQFESYLEKEEVNLERDGVAYRQTAFYFTDDEFHDFVHEIVKVFQHASTNQPAPDRKKRFISTIIIPEAD
ncbi:helix-turn-helix domain-containing protein [Niallia endozanthoxylica]|uniref:Helix-turn-helix domain-containing protein n=1 Tax=Niallia endozanthoxylica TaxID=2036016 RepID=A0A5J5I5W2_9BACI|nr:helix-turn-helix domain-containing protein [Niallia endozanthoxylica]KAA9031605.1 helix-turn-helix domain-containing protein [Niallia endozanthoxylica]